MSKELHDFIQRISFESHQKMRNQKKRIIVSKELYEYLKRNYPNDFNF